VTADKRKKMERPIGGTQDVRANFSSLFTVLVNTLKLTKSKEKRKIFLENARILIEYVLHEWPALLIV
jgi:hypothetical protein